MKKVFKLLRCFQLTCSDQGTILIWEISLLFLSDFFLLICFVGVRPSIFFSMHNVCLAKRWEFLLPWFSVVCFSAICHLCSAWRGLAFHMPDRHCCNGRPAKEHRKLFAYTMERVIGVCFWKLGAGSEKYYSTLSRRGRTAKHVT